VAWDLRARELMSAMGQNVTKLLRPLAAKSTTEHMGKILPREIGRLPPWFGWSSASKSE
jgi:hypothetical protein